MWHLPRGRYAEYLLPVELNDTIRVHRRLSAGRVFCQCDIPACDNGKLAKKRPESFIFSQEVEEKKVAFFFLIIYNLFFQCKSSFRGSCGIFRRESRGN